MCYFAVVCSCVGIGNTALFLCVGVCTSLRTKNMQRGCAIPKPPKK